MTAQQQYAMSIPATAESWRLPRFRNRRRLARLQRCRAVAVDWNDLRETGVAEDIVDMVLHGTEDQCAGRFACSPGRLDAISNTHSRPKQFSHTGSSRTTIRQAKSTWSPTSARRESKSAIGSARGELQLTCTQQRTARPSKLDNIKNLGVDVCAPSLIAEITAVRGA